MTDSRAENSGQHSGRHDRSRAILKDHLRCSGEKPMLGRVQQVNQFPSQYVYRITVQSKRYNPISNESIIGPARTMMLAPGFILRGMKPSSSF